MTWNELRKAVLTKMFASENGAVNLEDRDHADYLVSMPQAANEAMQYICAAGRRPRRSALIPVRKKTTRQMVDIESVCIDMDEDTLPLIAMYMAAELYKDDDVQIATIYRNEFEAMLAALSQKPQGVHGGEFTSVTGWYE